jgi:carotenoid cleavage dioxygenase
MGGLRYRHWFDGDGMVQAFRIGGGRISHLGRMVETPKYQAERAAAKRLAAAYGTPVPGARPPAAPDELNVANTSVLPIGGELLALWEGGSAFRLDPETLETRGPKTWRADLKGMPFSAHPRVEPDGRVWNIGISTMSGHLAIYRISAAGELETAAVIDAGRRTMAHDFMVTERHLVVPLPPLGWDGARAGGAGSFAGGFRWQPEVGTRVLVIDKADLTRVSVRELPAGMFFHFGNAWEEADGTIRFDVCWAERDDFFEGAAVRVMRGEGPATGERPTYNTLVTLPPSGAGRLERFPEAAEFPRVDPRFVGRRQRFVVVAASDGKANHPWLNSVLLRDFDSGRTWQYSYGPDVIAEEHVFVPRPGGSQELDGWLVGTALDVARQAHTLSIFEARRVGDGPVARARLDYPLPLGFHGQFAPS